VAVVGVFLISYYYLAGVVAFFAVVMNLLIVLGVMAALNATFTFTKTFRCPNKATRL